MRNAAQKQAVSTPDVKRRKRRGNLVPVQEQSTSPSGLSMSISPTLLGKPAQSPVQEAPKRRSKKAAALAPAPATRKRAKAQAAQPVVEPVKQSRKRSAKAVAPVAQPPAQTRKRAARKVELASKPEPKAASARPAPQMVASGRKRTLRGRKRIVVGELEGWGIYNRNASYLIGDFFMRKTDAISHLERDQKQPWSQIKHLGQFVPVRVTIKINEKDLAAAASQQ